MMRIDIDITAKEIKKTLKNKTILITGGSGYIGKEFVRYIFENNIQVKKIIIYSRSWIKQKEISEKYESDKLRFFIGDVRDIERLDIAMDNEVDVLIHAASIKDVFVCEDNPFEAIKTNVEGTNNVIKMCLKYKPKQAIFISTDKAYNPRNTYGTTKLLGEKTWLNANKVSVMGTVFSVCRYGNVFGSSGSVIEKWENIINKGKDTISITSFFATRFFIDSEKAVELIIQTIKIKKPDIVIPNLKSIKLEHLARAILDKNDTAKYVFVVGLNENEKLHEELDFNYSSETNQNGFYSREEINDLLEKWRFRNAKNQYRNGNG